MSYRKPWTDAELKQARAVVEKHTGMPAACAELSAMFGRGISITNFKMVCERRGLGNPRDWLKPPEARPAPDPIERAAERKQESQLKREHADLVERLRDAKAREDAILSLSAPHVPRIMRREKTSGLREATAQVLLSDLHVEERVHSVQVAGRNEYSLEIAERRLDRTFNATRWLLEFHREGFVIRDLILWLGGDLMTGYIHEENVETGELSPVETSVWLRDRICSGIDLLLQDKKIERLIVPCSYGNHGRTTKKPRRATGAANSFEWLLYVTIKKHYEREPRVEFVIDQSAHQFVDVYDWTNHYHHGDEFRFLGGVGGLSIPLNKRVPKWNNVRPSRYHHIGHNHQFLDLGHTLCNGSMIGYNAYAYSIGADFEPPQQAFCLYDSKRGKTCVSPIWCEGDAWAETNLWQRSAS